MKNFKAIVAAKKSHPENPQDLVFFSNKHNTAKGFADEIKALLEDEDENASFWFAPKVEKISEDEFNASQIDLGQIDEQSCEPEINYTAIAQNEVPESELPKSALIYYWFQYTVNNPIIMKILPVGEEFEVSYKFESEFFVELDRRFKSKENAITNALGCVIDDCIESPSKEHNTIIKAIGNRGENAFPEALMSPADIKLMVDAGRIEADPIQKEINGKDLNLKPWEQSPDIEHKKLYETIADITARYNGDKIPAVAECYEWIIRASAAHFGKDGEESPVNLEDRIISVISEIKNPHNFTNSTNVAQILMKAFPKFDHSLPNETARERLAAKFGDGSDKVERMVFSVGGDCKFFIEVSGDKFNKVKYNIHGDGFEYRDTAELDNKYEAVIFAINRIKGHLMNHLDLGLVNGIINNAKKDPLVWFDSYVDSKIPCESTRTKNTNECPSIKPESAKGEQKEPESLPETKISEQITQDSGQIDDLGFEFGDDKKAEIEPENNTSSSGEPEKSDFEKAVDSFNEKINALEIGESITFDDMPNEVYHACDGISSSQIKDAMLSMMYFNAKYNTKEIERTGGAHFDIGNVFHSICLEPDLTSKEYICEPKGDGVPVKPSDAQLEKYNSWLKLGSPEKKENPKAYPTDSVFERCGYWGDWYAENSGLCPVAADDWSVAEAMANSALNDEDSSKILRHPARHCEVSYFKRCDTTGMIIKARPDIELGRIIGDLKSISLRGQFDEKYLISALRKEVFNRNYHLSASMYLDITGKDQFLWIFTNKQKGYHWTATVRASSEILERGRELYAEYKQKIADSYNSGKWAKPESIQSKRNASDKIELPEI